MVDNGPFTATSSRPGLEGRVPDPEQLGKNTVSTKGRHSSVSHTCMYLVLYTNIGLQFPL